MIRGRNDTLPRQTTSVELGKPFENEVVYVAKGIPSAVRICRFGEQRENNWVNENAGILQHLLYEEIVLWRDLSRPWIWQWNAIEQLLLIMINWVGGVIKWKWLTLVSVTVWLFICGIYVDSRAHNILTKFIFQTQPLVEKQNHVRPLKGNITEPQHDKTKWVCTQRRLRSAWAFDQSDQSSLCAWRINHSSTKSSALRGPAESYSPALYNSKFNGGILA